MPSRSTTLPTLLFTFALGLAASAPAATPSLPTAASHPNLAAALREVSDPRRAIGFAPSSAAAKAGLAHILEGRALSGPFPLALYRVVAPAPDPVSRWLSEGAVPSPLPAGGSLGESIHRDPRGITLVSKTCLECHAGTAAGFTIAGAGNAHLDVVPLVETADRILAWDFTREAARWFPDQLRAIYRYVRDYKAYVRYFLLPPYRDAAARGDNLGPYGVWLMAGHMADPARSGILPGRPDDPRTKAERELLASLTYTTVDPQPWWTARYKSHAYWFYDSPGHAPRDFHFNFYYPERHVDHESILAEHRKKFSEHLAMVGEVLDYVKQVPVPPLPARQVSVLKSRWDGVLAGEWLFHGGPNSTGQPMACTGCHGRYELTADFANVRYADVGLVDAGTDRAYNDVMRRLAPIVRRVRETRAFYGEDEAPSYVPLEKPGYTPPVLVGLWASAPYLHNGSVPTLADLFTAPERRPTIWGRVPMQPQAWDAERTGLAAERIEPATLEGLRRAAAGQPALHPAAVEHRRFYDTRMPGRSNQGHPFGTDLAESEKRQLVDFLTALAPR